MRLGVIGGGQLAQMLAQAAEPLGIEVCALVENSDCPAQYAATLIVGDQHDADDVQAFAEQIDVLSFEFENVNIDNLNTLSLPIYPPLPALSIGQDRALEKQQFVTQQIPTTTFLIANNAEQLAEAVAKIEIPCVVKTCRDGYDGKGQALIDGEFDAQQLWQQLGDKRLLIENCVAFDREVSIIAVRSRDGEIRCYPLTENRHRDGVLHLSIAPYVDQALQQKAELYIKGLLKALDYVGVMAIEFFQVGDELIANELAPRVHNSGHWTIEGAQTSQFENHVRAVCGLPLGSTQARGHSVMRNFIGELPALPELLAIDNNHVHVYHKQPRVGRKLAHMTVTNDTLSQTVITQLDEV